MVDFIAADGSLDQYISEINAFPLLSRSSEQTLACEYRQTRDRRIAHRLMVSNLRFVVKVAHEYRGYGLRLLDLIQEGNIGLMMAVQKFDPDKGFRLISYAVWWIRAYIQNYILKSWSLVKLGTTQAQRKLFFKLRAEQDRADRAAPFGTSASAAQIAARLDVAEQDVLDMDVRLGSRDFSLDVEVQEGARHTHLDLLGDPAAVSNEGPHQIAQERRLLRGRVSQAMEKLNDKERYIVENRLMTDAPQTLQEIGSHFRISRERARQIEGNVIRKLRVVLGPCGFSLNAA